MNTNALYPLPPIVVYYSTFPDFFFRFLFFLFL